MIDFKMPIATIAPPQDKFKYKSHPVPLPNIVAGKPVQTNKFYGNLFLGSQRNPVWTHPYSLWITKEYPFNGVALTHIRAEQKVFDSTKNPPQYFLSPTNIKSIIFSAVEFGTNKLSLDR